MSRGEDTVSGAQGEGPVGEQQNPPGSGDSALGGAVLPPTLPLQLKGQHPKLSLGTLVGADWAL